MGIKLVWDKQRRRYQGTLALDVQIGTTQALENTLTVLRLHNALEAQAVLDDLVGIRSTLSDHPITDHAASGIVERHVTRPTCRGLFHAVALFGVRQDSNRRGVWAFVLCRHDEYADVLWKVFRRVAQSP